VQQADGKHVDEVRTNPIPTVTVIIPFFSGASWLAEAVDTVLSQTLPVHEILIVSDGSAEDISLFKERDARIRLIACENGGPGRARNLAIGIARGKYIAFLDSDDLWYPQKVERQISAMEDAHAVWSHTSYETFRDSSSRGKRRAVNLDDSQGCALV